MTAIRWTVTAALLAVNVYVVVTVGATESVPAASDDVNVPGVMATLVAPTVFHSSAAELPTVIVAGVAMKELMTGGNIAA